MLTTATATPLLVLLSLVGPESMPAQEFVAWQSLGEGVEHAVLLLPVVDAPGPGLSAAALPRAVGDEAAQGATDAQGAKDAQGATDAQGAKDAQCAKDAQGAKDAQCAKDADASPRPEPVHLHVVRIDPTTAELRAHLASESDEHPRTAQAWCRDKGLLAAINLGMYKTDLRSNVGFARKADHRNNAHLNEYRSFFGFGPRKAGLAAARLWDAEDPEAKANLEGYEVVVQNLRLVRGGGVSVWKKESRRWSEAAIASDKQGRILFLFVSKPVSMRDFTKALLKLPLEIERAMHVEGGPEASLSLCAPGLHLDVNGAFIGGVLEEMVAPAQMPIPNIIGVAKRGRRVQEHVSTTPH